MADDYVCVWVTETPSGARYVWASSRAVKGGPVVAVLSGRPVLVQAALRQLIPGAPADDHPGLYCHWQGWCWCHARPLFRAQLRPRSGTCPECHAAFDEEEGE